MKKLILLSLSTLLLFGCSKSTSNNPQPTATSVTVLYKVMASNSDNYAVDYEDPNGMEVTDKFTGTNWSKTQTFGSVSYLSPVFFYVRNTSGNTDNVTISLLINGKVVKSGTYTISQNSGAAGLSYPIN